MSQAAALQLPQARAQERGHFRPQSFTPGTQAPADRNVRAPAPWWRRVDLAEPGCHSQAMNKVSKLGREEFLKVVRVAPLVSVDIVVQDAEGRALMGLRSNEPAKGFWFVPGGRILKGERIAEAFERVVAEELGCKVSFGNARFLGVFQHFWDTNFAGEPGVSTHYVSLAYWLKLPEGAAIHGDPQHAELKWLPVEEALGDDRVHAYTKEFLAAARQMQRPS